MALQKGILGKGVRVILIAGKHYKEISQGFRHTTNNRMELLAVIVGLEQLKNNDSEVLVYSDSKYVVDSVEKNGSSNGKKNILRKEKYRLVEKIFNYL